MGGGRRRRRCRRGRRDAWRRADRSCRDASARRGFATGTGRYHRAMPSPSVAPGPLAGLTVDRLLDRPGRAVLHDAARRPRSGRHQGRAARRRRDARLGSRHGSVPTRTARGRRPTTSRSTATSARSGWTSRPRTAAEVLRRLLGRGDVLVENFRTGGFARLGFDDAVLAALNPAPGPPRHLRLWTRRPGRRPSRLRLRHPGDERADVDHRRRRRGRRQSDEGRRRDQRRHDRDAWGGERARVPAGARPWHRPDARPRPAHRLSLLASTLSALVNQAQNAFVVGRCARPSWQRASEHRPVRDVRDRRRRHRGRGRFRAPMAAVVRRVRVCPHWPTTRASRPTATESSAGPNSGRPSPSGSSSGRLLSGWPTLEAADIPAGPINDILAAFAVPEAVARGMTVEMEHPAWGVIRQVGVPFTLSATPASIRTPPPLLGADTDAILAEVGYDATAIRALRDALSRLTAATARAVGTTKRRRRAPRRSARRSSAPGSARRRPRPARPTARASAGPASPPGPSARDGRDRGQHRQDQQRHEPDPGGRGGRAGHACCRGT